MPLGTLDDKPFLRINGIQTQSESYIFLLDEIPALIEMGVSNLRLMPQDSDMVAIASIFRGRLENRIDTAEAIQLLSDTCGEISFSNGFYHHTAGIEFVSGA